MQERQKILIGLSGGIDSFVAAFLLKIQKHDLHAATVVHSPEEFEKNGRKWFNCHIDEQKLTNIKKFCKQMQIPLTIIRASEEYRDNVVDDWVSERISSKVPNTCYKCHKFRMNLLYKKMLELKLDSWASGHYAKIFKNPHDDSTLINSSSDIENDQSGLLLSLGQEVISKLVLPLSELQKKEVIKLGENFAIYHRDPEVKFNECLKTDADIIALLEEKIPEILRPPGEIIDMKNEVVLGNHRGLHAYTVGAELKETLRSNVNQKEIFFVKKYQYNEKILDVIQMQQSLYKGITLSGCEYGADIDLTKPMKGFYTTKTGESVECAVYFKTNKTAFVEFADKELFFIVGQMITLFKKRGGNARILLEGRISLTENFKSLERAYIEPKIREKIDEEKMY